MSEQPDQPDSVDGSVPKNQSLVPADDTANSLTISTNSQIDVSNLTDEQRQALQMEHARNKIANQRRADELVIDAGALRENLKTMSGSVREVSASGDSVTISHTQNSATGRTEVLMGNTEKAQSGKLTRTQTGEYNWMPIYIIIGVVAAIIIVLALISATR